MKKMFYMMFFVAGIMIAVSDPAAAQYGPNYGSRIEEQDEWLYGKPKKVKNAAGRGNMEAQLEEFQESELAVTSSPVGEGGKEEKKEKEGAGKPAGLAEERDLRGREGVSVFAKDTNETAAMTEQTSAEAAAIASGEDEIIEAGDLLEVNVYGSEWMHHPGVMIRVPKDGIAHFPLIGEFNFKGLTVKETARKLDERLLDGYLIDPQVSVIIVQRSESARPSTYSVSGSVRMPGRYPFYENIFLTDAVNMSGGMGPGADKNIKVIRDTAGEEDVTMIVDLDKDGLNFLVRPGDKIVIDTIGTFTVYGEVNMPGEYYVKEGLTVADAVLNARGFTPTAARNSVKVIRKHSEGKREIFWVPVAHIYRTGKKSDDVLVENGDIIIVPESWL